MKIAMVNQPWSACPPRGSADSIAILADDMSRRLAAHHEVTVYAPRFDGEQAEETIAGLGYRRVSRYLDYPLKPLRLLDRVGVLNPRRPHVASPLYFLGYILQVARDISRRQCNVIHLHNFSQYVPIVRFFNPRARIVLHMHCDWLTMLDEKLVCPRIAKADMVIGVSDFVTDRLKARFPDLADRFHTLYNGVDAHEFRPADSEVIRSEPQAPRIICVGRVSPEKGIHTLINAFELVLRKFPSAKLDIIGPGRTGSREFLDPSRQEPLLDEMDPFFRDRESYVPYLQSRLSPAAREAVRFVGCVPHEKLLSYYQASDVFVIPSVIHEPFGIPLAEAMACGLPAVATSGGGFPEICDNHETGEMVRRGDANALAEAILRLLANPDLRRAQGIAGRKRFLEHFSWDVVMPRLEEYYAQLGAGTGPLKPQFTGKPAASPPAADALSRGRWAGATADLAVPQELTPR
jgi:glycosyltransferase involved in cell wall biosynthesis